MLKNKLIITSIILSMTAINTNAETLSDIEIPKPPAYRVGISEIPEKQYIEAEQKTSISEKKYARIDLSQEQNIADLTYADLSIKRLSKEIAQDLEFEEKEMLADLSLLWQGAAVQSDTINFALYKLANPDADKPNEKSIKNVLKTIASMSTLVGASMGSPIIAGSSIIGGNIFNIMAQDTKALNYKYTRVTDADMIILIRKVEDLQQKAVDLYYDYMSAKKQLEYANELVSDREHKFHLAQKNNAPRELIVITDAYYRTAMDKQRNAKSEFFAKRAALEQFVGNETFLQFESELIEREKKNTYNSKQTTDNQPTTENNSEYQDTIKSVENYTNQISTQTVQNEELTQELPQLRPTQEYDGFSDQLSHEDPMRNFVTGFSSNIEETDEKTGFWSKFKKDRTEEKTEKKSWSERRLEAKDAKYSTKNLIFLHGEDKTTAKQRYAQSQNQINTPETTTNEITTNDIEVNNKKTKTKKTKDKSKSKNKDKNKKEKKTTQNNNPQTPEQITPQPEQQVEQIIQQPIVPQKVYTIQGLPPLDEIRVPELRKGGYSIHSDYNY